MKKHIKDFDISSAQHSELSFQIKDKKDEKLKQKKSFYFQHNTSHRLKNIIAIFLIFTVSNCIAQLDSIKTLDYSLADSIALNFHKKRYKSVRLITNDLTRGLKNEYDIYRVIFRWITDNIKYKKGKYGTDPDKILRQKKGVCEGYSHLLKQMCIEAGINCKVIVGSSKTSARNDINQSLNANHAWNAVKLNNNWYLTDITWASGYYNKKFHKEFDETYFLTDPNFFKLNHYPDEKRWLLTDKIYRKSTFKNSPVFHSALSSNGIKMQSKAKGKVKNKLVMKFSSETEIESMKIWFKNQKYFEILDFVKCGDRYEVNHKFGNRDYGEFSVFLNNEVILSYLKK